MSTMLSTVLHGLVVFIVVATCAGHSLPFVQSPGTEPCRSDRPTIYQLIMNMFWSSETFPKQHPEWKPKAQFAKVVGTFFIVNGLENHEYENRTRRQNDDHLTERVQLRSISNRSLDGSRTLQLSAFGKDHILQLTPTIIFTPDFKLIQATRGEHGNTEFSTVEEDQTNGTDDKGQLYAVNDGEGSLYVSDDNVTQVEGVVNDELRIVPNHNDYQKDGSLAHTVHQMPIKEATDHHDFVIPDLGANMTDASTNSIIEGVPAEVTVEVLVVFDHYNCKLLGFDLTKIRKYIAIFWNQIHYRFRDTSKPKINIAVSGLLTFKKPEDEPFIFEHKVGETRVEKECLGSFKNWLKDSKASLPKHDVAILQLGLDAGSFVDGEWSYELTGLAYVGTACSTSGSNSAFAEDTARVFDGFTSVAHELAHVLNVPHDGYGAAKDCPAGAGFVMGDGSKKTFSNCSIEVMENFVSSDSRKCLWDKPTIEVPLIDVWPVLMIEDLTEQCIIMFHNDSDFFFPRDVLIYEGHCEKLWCGRKNESVHYMMRGAYDGTPCGFDKVCLDRKCVVMPTPSLHEQCKKQFGNQFTAGNPADSQNVCQAALCLNRHTVTAKTLGRPLPGTHCGTQNLCLNGTCIAV